MLQGEATTPHVQRQEGLSPELISLLQNQKHSHGTDQAISHSNVKPICLKIEGYVVSVQDPGSGEILLSDLHGAQSFLWNFRLLEFVGQAAGQGRPESSMHGHAPLLPRLRLGRMPPQVQSESR